MRRAVSAYIVAITWEYNIPKPEITRTSENVGVFET
jgi:hypothetical protein